MVQTATSEIQTAISNILVPNSVLDATLASLGVTGVFDDRAVPENQAFDYITIGDIQERPNNTLGRRGYHTDFTIHIWSRALSNQNSQLMLARLNQLLDQVHISLATQAHVYTMYESSQFVPQPDGLTLHGIIKYMLYSEE